MVPGVSCWGDSAAAGKGRPVPSNSTAPTIFLTALPIRVKRNSLIKTRVEVISSLPAAARLCSGILALCPEWAKACWKWGDRPVPARRMPRCVVCAPLYVDRRQATTLFLLLRRQACGLHNLSPFLAVLVHDLFELFRRVEADGVAGRDKALGHCRILQGLGDGGVDALSELRIHALGP